MEPIDPKDPLNTVTQKIVLSQEDYDFLTETLANPPDPNPVLAAAMRRRHELLFNHAMDVIANSCDTEGNIVLRTDEDFDNLARELGIDPSTLDENGTDPQ